MAETQSLKCVDCEFPLFEVIIEDGVVVLKCGACGAQMDIPTN